MKNTKLALYATLLLLCVFALSCKDPDDPNNNNDDKNLPTVVTQEVMGVSQNSAVCYGNITDAGSSDVTGRGFCWSLNEDCPITDSVMREDTNLTGTYSMEITGLVAGTTYYVRAFASNSDGIALGEVLRFVTKPEGIVNGYFSVHNDTKVLFSQGNLQYQASTDMWRFAEHQYDYTGVVNESRGEGYDGWIDLFAFGASGYQGCTPWGDGTILSDIAGTNYDWGVYNPVSNGSSHAGIWRTLTKDEWTFLLTYRSGASQKESLGTVNNVAGLILLPDAWTMPDGITFTSGSLSFNANVYSLDEWAVLESQGAVFLPAAGTLYENVFYPDAGNYWTTTYTSGMGSCYLTFSSGELNLPYHSMIQEDFAVRLVTNY